ncbi:MAG: glycoside hydrolase family 28 protein, partial [Pedobacter sp.]
VSDRTPKFRNIHFSNITGQVNQAAYLNGLEEMPIENITFNDINMEAKTGFDISFSNRIEFHNVQVNTELGPSLRASRVNNLVVDGLKTYTPHNDAAVIDLKNVSDLFLYNAFPVAGTANYLRLSGAGTKNISLGNNNFKNARVGVKKEKDVYEAIDYVSGDKGQ